MNVEAPFASRPAGELSTLIAARHAESEEARFRQAVIEHYPGLRKFLRRMGLPAHRADDVAQTAFLVAFERLPRLMVGSERAFLFSAAVRIAHSVRRGATREVLDADLDRDSSPDPSPEEFAHQKRVREVFEALLDSIERESRAVFVRFEVDGLTIPEIAEVLAISRETATRRLRRARKQFRALVRHVNLA